jgi:hypothetical protein
MTKFRIQGADFHHDEQYVYVYTRQDVDDDEDEFYHLDIAVWPMDSDHALGEIITNNDSKWTPVNWVCA